MANIQSAKKRARQAVKRHEHNTSLRSRTSTYLKKARYAISACEKQKDEALLATAKDATKLAMSFVDRMIPKGIFHKNKAARLKSRLNSKLKKVVQAA